jgi:PKHD-type hydroxylase
MNYLPYYWIRHNIISSEMCDLVLQERKLMPVVDAGVGVDNEGDTSGVRKTTIAWAPRNHWLEGVMLNNIMYANRETTWNFCVDTPEQVQIAEYAAGNFYDWHVDTFLLANQPFDRKLTAVLQLNDSSEFEGGHLQIKDSGVDSVPLKKGSIAVFPSYLTHRATEVTAGVRYSAALWVSGKSFR